MPEITPETFAVLARAAAATGVEQDKHLVDAVLAAIDADPAFAQPVQSWQERAAEEIVRRYFALPPSAEPAEEMLESVARDVLAEFAPAASDPEAHAALMRLVRAAEKWSNSRDGRVTSALLDALDALPESVRKEAGL